MVRLVRESSRTHRAFTVSMACSFPGCERHPSKGDTILRISAKGVPFVGRCEKHYGGEDGEQLARGAEEAARAALDSHDPKEGT